jgi:hypothetical protein
MILPVKASYYTHTTPCTVAELQAEGARETALSHSTQDKKKSPVLELMVSGMNTKAI